MFDKDHLQFPLFAALLKWSFKLYTFIAYIWNLDSYQNVIVLNNAMLKWY
jgi:hypothetical protein